ncbi:MAG: copper-translocating P-type ATPase [Alphaproteobacteria bacterium]|nr:copper-translocating P-type ATPase [Alphaproteobacteria bacterium]
MDHSHHHAHSIKKYKDRFFICMFLTLWIFLIHALPNLLDLTPYNELFSVNIAISSSVFILSSIIFFYGGWPFLSGTYSETMKKQPGMMTLIGLAITTAYIYSVAVLLGVEGESFFLEIVTLIDIMLLGHWIEMKSILGAGSALNELASLLPRTARFIAPDGQMYLKLLHEIQKGDRLLIKPGESIPADGLVIEGQSFVNESMLSGESTPVEKKIGKSVWGGSINYEGSLTIQATHVGENGFLPNVIRLVRQAQASKSFTQDLANRAAKWLTLLAITAGILTFIAWLWFSSNFSFAVERAVTVMIITCPHALGLAIPLVVSVSTSIAARNGFLIRDRSAFEKARQINVVVFDKTGTLTKGDFRVSDIISLNEAYTKEQVLTYAASLEQYAEHPLAKSIAQETSERVEVKEFTTMPGIGAMGKIDGHDIKIVSPGYLQENGLDKYITQINSIFNQGKTIVFLLLNQEVIGAIALSDRIREESKQAIADLQKQGIHCVMLTGDNKFVARAVAEEIGINEFVAEVLPGAKAIRIRDLQEQKGFVAMVGDGVNDAPALAQADLGIAIGAGTDIAMESADIILIKNNPQDVVTILKLAKNSYKKMQENLIWATGYNAIAIPLAAGVFWSIGIHLSPALGAVLMSLSTIICAINAKLLRL